MLSYSVIYNILAYMAHEHSSYPFSKREGWRNSMQRTVAYNIAMLQRPVTTHPNNIR